MPSTRTRTREPGSAGHQLWRAKERPDHDGPLLLDTHIWVWTLEGDRARLAPTVISLVERASAEQRLAVCDISFWEVAVKTGKGKLVLSLDPAVWLSRAERAPGIRVLALDRMVLLQSTRLPGEVHGDPADRILIATAQLHGMSLVTADERIIEYAGRQRGIPVCDARA